MVKKMRNEIFKKEDYVLLIHNKKKRWLVQLQDKTFHCDLGRVNLNEIIGKKIGYTMKFGSKLLHCVQPTAFDWIRNMKHSSQIIYEKDAAMIALLLDIQPGKVIYEAGTGSGSLTSVLSRLVGSTGKVVTHEVREEAYKSAKQNLARMGLTNVEFNLTDIKQGFVSGQADGLILDMVDPWLVISHVTEVLKPSGKLVLFQPTFNQLEKCEQELRKHNFTDISAIELIEREIEIKENAVRPATRMVGHTGFLISARFLGKYE